MAQEEVTYNIPAQGGTGTQADIVFTYDPTKPNTDGSFTVTNATGTYKTLNASGAVVDTDTVTGVSPLNTSLGNDNELFIVANPTTSPIVTLGGVSFTINNAADSNDGLGNVDLYDGNGSNAGIPPSDTTPLFGPIYFEDDSAHNMSPATSITESPAVCYASGTSILTVNGYVAVERLSVGDMAVTGSGEHRPIRWLGHRVVNCRRHPRPQEIMPVRVAAHAFGENRPAKDLVVSPGHALCVDVLGEVLIPASSLINGTTIVQEDVDRVTYWHVELDSHEILLADNMPAESYLDMGNRLFFAESKVVDIEAAPEVTSRVGSHADFCRPFHASGAIVDAVRDQLRRRAETMSSEMVDGYVRFGLHLVTALVA